MLTDNLKSAFDGVRAEERLKADTVSFLRTEIQRRGKRRRHYLPGRLAAAAAAVAVIFLSGMLTHELYFTPNSYVDLDVNPSIELTLNRFDRVIDAYAFNGEGEEVLSELSLRHKSYEDALILLMDEMNRLGYIRNDGLVSVTLQTDNAGRETELLSGIQSGVETYLSGHSQAALIDVFPVSGETREVACEQGLSPAKYLAIQELIQVDPSASVDSCRNHSISEIREMTRAHGNHHESADSGSEDTGYSGGQHGKQGGGHSGKH